MTTTELIDVDGLEQAFEGVNYTFTSEPTPDVYVNGINVTKADRILNFLETHVEKHNQGVWADLSITIEEVPEVTTIDQAKAMGLGACDTVGCFAGWTAAMDGHYVGTTDNLEGIVLDLTDQRVLQSILEGNVSAFMESDHVTWSDDYAQEVLGLDDDQASELFEGDNSRADLRRMLSRWTDGAIPATRFGTED